MSKPNNLINQKFDRLLVIERAENDRFGKTRWICQCDCGNTVTINGSSLLRGLTKSCGCYKKEKSHLDNVTFIDETHNKYGKLLVLERDLAYGNNGRALWKCQCECGNIVSVQGKRLRNGVTLSCGCLKKSHGEFHVESLLREYNINFVFNYFIKYNNNFYYFDFGIIINDELSYFIEYDGIQHFKESTNSNWDPLEVIQKKDEMKNQYCKENNIPLIRIPYTHLKELILEDLLLDTSQFVIKE